MSGGLDPFAGLNLEMQRQAKSILPPSWCLGRVTAVGPGTLRIVANGMELDEEDLWVNPRLLAGYEEPVQVKIALAEGKEACEVSLDVEGEWVQTYIPIGEVAITSQRLYELPGVFTGILRGTLEVLDNRLQVGDWVALLPDANEEFYYVLTKVVRP